MKKVGQILLVLVVAIGSVVAIETAIRKFYRRWSKKRYTELSWEPETFPWE